MISKLQTITLYFFAWFLIGTSPLRSQPYHNITGFFGERAAGLSGAYSALSDDPSGAYYNPAGMAFANGDQISISASNYNQSVKRYRNVDSPNEDYTQSATNLLPNFMGFMRSVGNYKISFSIVNTYNTNYKRNDQISVPVFSPTILNSKNYNQEIYNQMQIGPSLSYLINSKWSIGGTLYYTIDTADITRTQLQQYNDNSYVIKSYVDNRKTNGFLPILGIQYQPSSTFSFGASIREQIVSGKSRYYNEFYADSLRASSSNNVDFTEGVTNSLSSIDYGYAKVKPKLNGEIPHTREFRIGGAYYPTSRFLISSDIIYTAGYKKTENQIEVGSNSAGKQYLYAQNPDRMELYRRPTTNYAVGMEYYLTDSFSLMGGFFTNLSNAKPISWNEEALALAIRNQLSGQTYLENTSGTTNIRVDVPALTYNPRNEFSNNRGFSLGFGWSNANTGITFTIVRETGSGSSQIDRNSLPQTFIMDVASAYIVVTSKK